MKSLIHVCVVGSLLICAAEAQDPSQPVLREGVSVQMALADHAVAVPAADAEDAIVVAITADGKVFVGTKPSETSALSNLSAETVYVKADARAPFQKVLSVLDALTGKPVVLLAAPPENVGKAKIVPPYGVKLILSR